MTKNVNQRTVDLDLPEMERREPRLEELPSVVAEQGCNVGLCPAPAVLLDDRMNGEVPVLDAEDKEPGPIVLRVREAEHVVNQPPVFCVVAELEVPSRRLLPYGRSGLQRSDRGIVGPSRSIVGAWLVFYGIYRLRLRFGLRGIPIFVFGLAVNQRVPSAVNPPCSRPTS